MARHTGVDAVEIGVDGVLKRHTPISHRFDGGKYVVRAEGDVLDTLTLVVAQEFLDLGVLVTALVQRDADLATGAGHSLGDQRGLLAFDIEVADLAEVEDVLIERCPGRHLAAPHVVGQVVQIGQAHGVRCGRVGGTFNRYEVDVVDFLSTVAIHQIEV